jgi:hypothetical protein
MELAKSKLTRYERFRSLTRYSITLALGGLFGSLILGPYGLIPEAVAWGVGVTAPIVFGAISLALFFYMEDTFGTGDSYNAKSPDITKMRHEVENATEAYFASLSE